MKKTKRFAAMAAAIAVCAGVTTYLPQDIFSSNVMSASAVEEAELSSLEIYGEAITDFQFHVNEDILNSILSVKNLHARIYDIHDEEYLDTPINDTDFIFDLSAVDTSTPGVYTITASYAYDESISTTFYIGIVTWEMEIYGESFTDFQFSVNDDILDNILSDNKLYARIYDSYGEEYLFEPINDTDYTFDLSAVDTSTAGVYPVTVSYALDESISTVFDIEIIDLQEETEPSKMEICSENGKGFQFHVNDDILNCILSDNMLCASIYDTDGTAILRNAPLNDTDFIFDLSNVNTSIPGTYPVTVSYAHDDSISTTFTIGIVPWQMEIHGESFTDFQFHVNDDIIDKLTTPNTALYANIYDIYGERYFSNEFLNTDNFIFDLSAVDISTAGIYPVTVSYAFDESISTTFDIELFAWEMEIYGENESDFTFHVNDDILEKILSDKNLYARIYDEHDEEYLSRGSLNTDDFIFDLSAVDTSTAGTYPVTVTYAYDESISTTFDIEIVEWQMEICSENESYFHFHVNDDILEKILSDNNLYANIYDIYGEVQYHMPLNVDDFIFDLSAVDTSTAGTYPVTIGYAYDDSISTTFDIEIVEWQMEIYGENDTDFRFHVNDDILDKLAFENTLHANIYDIYGEEQYHMPLNVDDFIFDLSAVDISTAGTYPVTVGYAYNDSISTTFDIEIIEWQMEIYGENDTDFRFHVNDDILDKLAFENTLHANIYDIYGEEYLSNASLNVDDFIFNLSAVDISTAGTYPVTVGYAYDDSITTTFDIEIVDWQMEIYSENDADFHLHVNDDIIDKLTSQNILHAHIFDSYGEEYYNGPLNVDDFIFNISAVDISTPGVYPVTIGYAYDDSITTTFDIEIVEWQMEIYSDNDNDFLFYVNDDIIEELAYENYLQIHIFDIYDDEIYHFTPLRVDDFIFDLSAVDTSTPGTYPVTVALAYDESITATFDITIVEFEEIDTPDDESILLGDANCDGKITMADAAAIFQNLGNPDKYQLSEQGKKNADVEGNKNGITVDDAIAIMKFQAGLIEEF